MSDDLFDNGIDGAEFANEYDHYDFITEYKFFLQYCEFDSMMDRMKADIAEEKQYGSIWDAADWIYEQEHYLELEEEERERWEFFDEHTSGDADRDAELEYMHDNH